MGIEIGLSIIPEKISSELWQEVYEESLLLLEAYPFASLRKIEKGKREIPVLSSQLEHNKDDCSKRFWALCGDLKSKKTGENFQLYYDLSHYCDSDKFNTDKNQSRPEDILVHLLDYSRGGESKGKDVFFNKTQGLCYHNYILALAMLFETRLYPHAATKGYITYGQAQKAKEWADEHLLKPVDIPARLNLKELHKRLTPSLTGLELIQGIEELWLGDPQEFFDYSLAYFGQSLMEKWLAKRLRGSFLANETEPTKKHMQTITLGDINLFIQWLNATEDLERLAYISCKDPDGPLFSADEFCEAIPGTWLTIPNEKYSFLKYFELKPGESDTVDTMLVDIVMQTQFTGRKMKIYYHLDKAIQVLQNIFPQVSDTIEKRMREQQGQIEEIIENQRDKYAPYLENMESLENIKKSENEYEEEVFLYYDGNEDQDDYEFIELAASSIKMVMDKCSSYENYKDLLAAVETKGWKGLVFDAIETEKLILTEEALEWIEKEQDEEVLKLLFFSTSLNQLTKNNSITLNLVRGMFENRDLALRIKGLAFP